MYSIIKRKHEEIDAIKFSEVEDTVTAAIICKSTNDHEGVWVQNSYQDSVCNILTEDDAKHLIEALQMAIEKGWWVEEDNTEDDGGDF
jgi:hypothetical protein